MRSTNSPSTEHSRFFRIRRPSPRGFARYSAPHGLCMPNVLLAVPNMRFAISVKFQQRYVMSHRNLPGLRGFASDPDGLNRILVGLIDRLQRQMLVDLQALFG